MSDIFINDVFTGTCPNAKKFVDEFRKLRREGVISENENIQYNDELDYIYIDMKKFLHFK